MLKKRHFGIIVFAAVIAFSMIACPDSGSGGGGNPEIPVIPIDPPITPIGPPDNGNPGMYIFTYNGNGSTGGVVPANPATYNRGAEVTVLDNTGGLVKTGYKFAGWNTAPGGIGSAYFADYTFFISANTTLYAQWLPDAYGIWLGILEDYITDASDKPRVFPYAALGYGNQTAKTVIVHNDGNQPTGTLTIASNNPGGFTLSSSSIASIAVGDTDSFTVVPKTGLAAGSHSATVTVSGEGGITASFIVSFDVYPSLWYTSQWNYSRNFTITTAAELAELAQIVNGTHGSSGIIGQDNFGGGTVTLANNIDLSAYGSSFNGGKGWIPIGTTGVSYEYDLFSGTFDGNGKKITGLYINDTSLNAVGLFAVIDNGNVKNLGVEDVNIIGNNCVGGIVGFVRNYSDLTITNCYSTGNVSGIGDYVGGVVGGTGSFYCRLTISNCYFTGNVSGSDLVGGVLGYLNQGTVTDCYFKGNVSGSGAVGGVVGQANNIVSNCYSTGDVSGSGNVGGVVGYAGYAGTITNCYSTGNISGSGDVGGVVGYGNTVTDCYSTGNVSGNSSINKYSQGNDNYTYRYYGHVGGVVGRTGGDSTVVSNCYSTGDVSGTMTQSLSYGDLYGDFDVGGVVGNLSGTVTGCYSTGNVSGSYGKYSANIGGVVGTSDWNSSSTITNCYSAGDVSGGSGAVGGVVGELVTRTTVSNCYSTGDVHGTDGFAGGVVGLASDDGGTVVSNCYSTGNIICITSYAFQYIGSVVGREYFLPGAADTTVKNCVALNPKITLTYVGDSTYYPNLHFSRVGFAGSLINNYARQNMIAGDKAFSGNKGTDKEDGEDITSTQWNSASWWTEIAQFSTAVWNISNNSLPTLKNMPGLTLQNPVVKN
jgi:hypothetical protein